MKGNILQPLLFAILNNVKDSKSTACMALRGSLANEIPPPDMLGSGPLDFSGGSGLKNPPVNAGDAGDSSSVPWVRKILWRGKWQTTQIFLPKKSHGQWNLEGCSPRDHSQTLLSTHTHNIVPLNILSPEDGAGRRTARPPSSPALSTGVLGKQLE